MTEQTLGQRFHDLQREPTAPDWSNVIHRAAAMSGARRRFLPWRLQTSRRKALIAVAAAMTALAFASVAFSLNRPSLPFTAPGPGDAAEVFSRAPGAKDKIHEAPRVDGETWDLRSYQNVRGDLCFSHEVPGELVGTGCLPAEELFKRGPLVAYPGARQISAPYRKVEWDNQWVYGIAHPDIKTLTLVNMDCSTVALVLDKDGAFHYVASRQDIRSGRQMYKLVARGQTGAVLAERKIAMGLPKNAKDAGLEPPRPGAACRYTARPPHTGS
jgi:hypothetical protein